MIKYILARLETRRYERIYNRYMDRRRRLKELKRLLYTPIQVDEVGLIPALIQSILGGIVVVFLLKIVIYEYEEAQEQLLNYIYEKRLPYFIKVKK